MQPEVTVQEQQIFIMEAQEEERLALQEHIIVVLVKVLQVHVRTVQLDTTVQPEVLQQHKITVEQETIAQPEVDQLQRVALLELDTQQVVQTLQQTQVVI